MEKKIEVKKCSDYLEFNETVEKRVSEREFVKVPALLTAKEIKKAGKLIAEEIEVEEGYYLYESESFIAVLSDDYLSEEPEVMEFYIPRDLVEEIVKEWMESNRSKSGLLDRIKQRIKLW